MLTVHPIAYTIIGMWYSLYLYVLLSKTREGQNQKFLILLIPEETRNICFQTSLIFPAGLLIRVQLEELGEKKKRGCKTNSNRGQQPAYLACLPLEVDS